MEFLIILPLLMMALTAIMFSRSNGRNPAQIAIATLVAVSLFVYLSAEFLSVFSSISAKHCILLWSASVAILIVARLRQNQSAEQGNFLNRRLCQIFKDLPPKDKALGIVILSILAGTLVSGLLGSPNTCDALVYHIPRVLHWSHNGSLDFYPTHIERQLNHPPLIEYWFLHFWLLTGSDRFFNLVQWGSFIGCLALSVAFARAINSTGTGVRLSLLYTATLPVAVMQASSPKNDLFFAFHMWAFAYFLLLTIQRFSWKRALLAGTALGLSLATKGTAFLFAPAIGLPLGIYWLCRTSTLNDLMQRFARLVAVALFGVILASPHMIRSFKHYGTISSSGSDQFKNTDYTPQAIFGNTVRMIASNLATPVPAINQRLQHGLEKIVGSQLNNRNNIYLGEMGRNFKIDAAPTETKMSNPIHMIVFTIVCPLLILRWKRNPFLGVLSLCAIMTFMAFTIMIQWADWVTRYHITALLLAAPLAGHLLAGESETLSSRNIKTAVCAIAASLAIFCSVFNVYRPIIPFRGVSILTTPRYDQFFMYDNSPRSDQYRRKELMESAVKSSLMEARPLNGTSTIGLICSPSSTEYLWWKVADETSDNTVIFQQVYTNNIIPTSNSGITLPDAIIIESRIPKDIIMKAEADGFRKIADYDDYMVYTRKTDFNFKK